MNRAAKKANPYQQYKEMHVNTASPAQLVIMLYDGAIAALKMAIEHIESKDYEAKQKQLNRVQDIIFELMNSLNLQEGGEIAGNLQKLYIYMNKRIMEANINLDTKILEEVTGLLDGINNSWKQIAKQQAAGGNAIDSYSNASVAPSNIASIRTKS